MWLESAGALADAVRSAELGQLGHPQPRVAAWIDAAEWLEVERHIQREAVEAPATTHAHTNARELAVPDVHPRCFAPRRGGNAIVGRQLDDGALEGAHELAHPKRRASQVDQRVHHQLSRAVIGDLA